MSDDVGSAQPTFFGYMGASMALILANIGAAIGTSKAGMHAFLFFCFSFLRVWVLLHFYHLILAQLYLYYYYCDGDDLFYLVRFIPFFFFWFLFSFFYLCCTYYINT